MTEKYLHYLWKSKQFPSVQTTLTNGEEIVVKEVGEYNEYLRGPDFRMGSIYIRGALEYGPIEMHVNSSDWYTHKHHLDDNYNNVILHVVFKNDKPVIQNGREIPTLELQGFLKQRKLLKQKESAFFEEVYPCSSEINHIDSFFLGRMFDVAFQEKMRVKSKKINELNASSDQELLFHFLSIAFGMKINQNAFFELVRKLPFDLLSSMTKNERRQFVCIQIELMSLNSSHKLWHRKGTRPSAFPDKRMEQYVEFISEYNFDDKWWVVPSEIKLSLCRSILKGLRHSKVISVQFEHHLIVNGLVPFIWQLGELYSDELYQSCALKILEELPAEKNSEIRKASCLIEKPKNAFETQGVLALNRYYCSRKKCLSCDVGNKVLNRLQ